MGLRIVADELITWVREAFTGDDVTSLELLPAAAIDRERLRRADVLLVRSKTKVDAALLDGTPVRFVGSATVGVDHVDEDWLRRSGIHFVAAAGSSADSVCQFTWAMAILLCDRLGRPFRDLTVAVIGAGAIGERVAATGERLGLRALRYDPPLAEAGTWPDRRYCSRAELRSADIVSLHLPLVRDGIHATFRLADRDFLADLGRRVLLIDTSRGDVVDDAALVAALASGQVAGAALDVFTDEPRCDAGLLARATWRTPHVAGRSLEGMTGNTMAVFDAYCRHFGVRRTFDPAPLMPPAPAFDPDHGAGLAARLDAAWHLSTADRALAAAAVLDGAERGRVFERARVAAGRTFDAARGAHDLRRDLTAYRRDAALDGELARFVAAFPVSCPNP